jgi:hypothetical protein
LEIPVESWADLSMDFVVSLSASKDLIAIWSVVDCPMKIEHLVPGIDNGYGKELGELYVKDLF